MKRALMMALAAGGLIFAMTGDASAHGPGFGGRTSGVGISVNFGSPYVGYGSPYASRSAFGYGSHYGHGGGLSYGSVSPYSVRYNNPYRYSAPSYGYNFAPVYGFGGGYGHGCR